MDETNRYEIKLYGCHDTTVFEMLLTNTEYELLKRVSEKANETSEYSCMPRMDVEEVNTCE